MTHSDIHLSLADERRIYRVEDVERAIEQSAPSRNEALAAYYARMRTLGGTRYVVKPSTTASLEPLYGRCPNVTEVLEERTKCVALAVAACLVEMPALNVVAIECAAAPGTRVQGLGPGLPDDAFDHDGQLTKRDLRASALSRLAPVPGELLWDLGAGAGSIAIEWASTDPSCRGIAVERTPERAARIASNVTKLGVAGAPVIRADSVLTIAELPIGSTCSSSPVSRL